MDTLITLINDELDQRHAARPLSAHERNIVQSCERTRNVPTDARKWAADIEWMRDNAS